MIKKRKVLGTEKFNCSVLEKDKIYFTGYTDKFLHVEVEIDQVFETVEIMMSPEDSLKLYKLLEKNHGGK